MVKRRQNKEKGNELERSVQLIEISGSDHEILLQHRMTNSIGIKRELDVYDVTSCKAIECKNYTYPISIEKIEAFEKKCDRLPDIKERVYVAASAYQRGARQIAEAGNIKLLRANIMSNPKTQDIGIDKLHLVHKDISISALFIVVKEQLFNTFEDMIFVDANQNRRSYSQLKVEIADLDCIEHYWKSPLYLVFNRPRIVYLNLAVTGMQLCVNDDFLDVDKILAVVRICMKMDDAIPEKVTALIDSSQQVLGRHFQFSDLVWDSKAQFHIVHKDNRNHFFSVLPDNERPLELSDLGAMPNIEDIKYPGLFSTLKIPRLSCEISESCKNSMIENADFSENTDAFLKHGSTYIAVIENKLNIMIPVIKKGQLSYGMVPDPISLFVANCVNLYNRSVEYRANQVFNLNEASSFSLWSDGDFHGLIQSTINCMIMLKISIEFFVNQHIPDATEIQGLNKKQLLEQYTLKEKIEKILITSTNYDIEKNRELTENILLIDQWTNKLMNMPTSDNVIHQPFIDIFRELINLDLRNLLEQTIEFFQVNGNPVLPIEPIK